MQKTKFLIAILSLFPLFVTSPSFAQASKGTAGFLSGAGNTTSSNSNLSVPSFENRNDTGNTLSTLSEGTTTQRKLLSIIQNSVPTFNLERNFNTKFENYLALPPSQEISIEQTKSLLQNINQITGKNQAIIYVFFNSLPSNVSQLKSFQPHFQLTQEVVSRANIYPRNTPLINSQKIDKINFSKEDKSFFLSSNEINISQSQAKLTDELQLLMITSQGVVPLITVKGATRREVIKTIRTFEQNLSLNTPKENYLSQAKQLYQWIIKPIEQQLEKQNIENITFILDNGLRTLPIAALFNNQTNKFLIEDYSVGLMPSLSLTDLTPKPRAEIVNTKVLAMGAETFSDQKPLPAVPIELSEITQKILTGSAFLNRDFTVDNLKKSLLSQEFNIVHLATHGEFQPGDRSNSFIYFSDQRLTLDQFSQLGLDNPKIDLLVLSACRTAFGDPDSELGFAGLAVKTGARTALGSLWNVSDEGTLALMTMFYENLKTTPMKAEALRQAQLAFVKGNITINNNELVLDNKLKVTLSPELVSFFNKGKDFRNPYYWSAFTLIGNPW